MNWDRISLNLFRLLVIFVVGTWMVLANIHAESGLGTWIVNCFLWLIVSRYCWWGVEKEETDRHG